VHHEEIVGRAYDVKQGNQHLFNLKFA